MIRLNKVLMYSLIIGIGIALVGCGGGGKYGDPVPTDMPAKQIKEILAAPDQFDGKIVKVEGKIGEECPSGCWFYIEDGTGRIYVDINPAGFAIPQKVGSKVAIIGKVKKAEAKVAIFGTGVEIK